MAMTKVLRVALIQGARVIEDRTLKKHASVSVGSDTRNLLIVPSPKVGAAFTLFEFSAGQYALVFADGMDGRVHMGDSDLSFSALLEQGLAKRRGNLNVLPLTENTKGRIVLDDFSVLFQFVTPPPEPPKPELPPSIQTSFLAQLDRLFFGILGVSIALHFSGATFIACQPRPEEKEIALEDLQDRFAKVLMPVEKPPVKKEEKGDEKKVEEKEEKRREEKKPVAEKSATERKAAIQKKVASAGLLKILGSAGAGSGALENVLGGSSGAGDISEALSGASGVGVATAVGAAGQKGGGSGKAASIGDLGTAGGGNVNIGSKGDAAVRGKLVESAPEVESGDVDRDALAAYVRARKASIQRCYENELKRNPSLKGKVVVSFTITPRGRAGKVSIEENTLQNDAVSSCIASTIRGWVFPFKPADEVSITNQFVFAPAS